jgi:hypothetical protein
MADHSGPDPDEVITLAQAAAIAGLTTKTLHTQQRRGRLPLRKLGRDRVITRRELHKYLLSRDPARGHTAPVPADYETPRGMAPLTTTQTEE